MWRGNVRTYLNFTWWLWIHRQVKYGLDDTWEHNLRIENGSHLKAMYMMCTCSSYKILLHKHYGDFFAKSALLTLLSHSWKIKNKKQWSNLVPRALPLFIRERTVVAAGHVEMCVKKLRSGGRSSTKFCRQDNEILSGVGRKFILQNDAWGSEMRANFFAFGSGNILVVW